MTNGTSKEKLSFCKCKRSACVRNYCQCYDQKRVCGSDCRCFSEYIFCANFSFIRFSQKCFSIVTKKKTKNGLQTNKNIHFFPFK